jgi:hypothetical protein
MHSKDIIYIPCSLLVVLAFPELDVPTIWILHEIYMCTLGPTACGTKNDILIIRDLGDGKCVSAFSKNGSAFVGGDCTTLAFNKTCGNYAGLLTIFISNDGNASAATYAPQINTWLTNLGLAGVQTLGTYLQIYVDNTPNPIPTPIQPVFLSSLEQVGSLLIKECLNCGVNPDIAPPTSQLVSLPGFLKLQQFTGFPGTESFFTLQNTRFGDMKSFSSLYCPPTFMLMPNNKFLVSLEGLQTLRTQNQGGTFFNATGSGPFTNVSASYVTTLAGCSGASTPFVGNFFLPVTPCVPSLLINYAEYCRFVAAGTCPAT